MFLTACSWHDKIVLRKKTNIRHPTYKEEIGTAWVNDTLSCITMHTYIHTYIKTSVFVLGMYHKMCSRSKPLLSFDLVSSSSSSSTCYASLMLFLFLFILDFFWGVKSLPHVVAFFLCATLWKYAMAPETGNGWSFPSMGWLMLFVRISTRSLTLNCLKLLSNSYRILGILLTSSYNM